MGQKNQVCLGQDKMLKCYNKQVCLGQEKTLKWDEKQSLSRQDKNKVCLGQNMKFCHLLVALDKQWESSKFEVEVGVLVLL